MTDTYKSGDLIVGYLASDTTKTVFSCINEVYAVRLGDAHVTTVAIRYIRDVERATAATVSDLIPERKKRFVKAVIDSVDDTNFHIFDHETGKYVTFSTESTRNVVVNELNGGSEVSNFDWTTTPQTGNGMNFRVNITPNPLKPVRVRYQAYTSAERDDTQFHIIDTETGKYASYRAEDTRNRVLHRLNHGGFSLSYWSDTPNVVVPPTKDHTELLAVTQMMIEAHELINPKSSTVLLLRRLKNALARGN